MEKETKITTLKNMRVEREKLRKQWSILTDAQRQVDFDLAIDLRKQQKESFKKWAFYDGIIKALDK